MVGLLLVGSSDTGPASGIAAGLTAVISSIVARSLLLDLVRQIDIFFLRERKSKRRCIIMLYEQRATPQRSQTHNSC